MEKIIKAPRGNQKTCKGWIQEAAMRELCEVRAIPVTIRGKKVWVRTDIAGNAIKLFKAIGVKPPPKVLNLEARNPAGTNP